MTDTPVRHLVFRMYWIYDEAGDLLYIGESNDTLRRFVEHLRDKRWAGEVADHRRDRRVFASKAEAQAAEKAAVEEYRPRFNIEYNLGNPDRVDPETMRFPDGRLYRPDLYHQPGAAAAPVVSTGKPGRSRTPVRRGRSPRREHPAGKWFGGWLLLAAVGWVAACRWLGVGVWPGAQVGGVASTVLLAVLRVATLSRRQREMLRRLVVGALATAAVGWVLWVLFVQQAAGR